MRIDPCPFCKKPVEVDTLVPANWFSKLMFPAKTYVIQCRNEICRIQPSTEQYERRESAIESWNYSEKKDMPY